MVAAVWDDDVWLPPNITWEYFDHDDRCSWIYSKICPSHWYCSRESWYHTGFLQYLELNFSWIIHQVRPVLPPWHPNSHGLSSHTSENHWPDQEECIKCCWFEQRKTFTTHLTIIFFKFRCESWSNDKYLSPWGSALGLKLWSQSQAGEIFEFQVFVQIGPIPIFIVENCLQKFWNMNKHCIRNDSAILDAQRDGTTDSVAIAKKTGLQVATFMKLKRSSRW